MGVGEDPEEDRVTMQGKIQERSPGRVTLFSSRQGKNAGSARSGLKSV